jgi:hypothetical protein
MLGSQTTMRRRPCSAGQGRDVHGRGLGSALAALIGKTKRVPGDQSIDGINAANHISDKGENSRHHPDCNSRAPSCSHQRDTIP